MDMRQATTVTLACVLITMVAAAAPVDGQRNQTPRLRCDNARIRELIQFALERSDSFRDLIATLDLSDRIVYVEEGSCPGRTLRSCLFLMPNARNLVVHINPREPIRGAAAALAHELYHAAEIERSADVADAEGLRALYERIGEQSCVAQSHNGCWETRAARAFEALVVRQLASGKTGKGPETPDHR
jgi:hypothetical protein